MAFVSSVRDTTMVDMTSRGNAPTRGFCNTLWLMLTCVNFKNFILCGFSLGRTEVGIGGVLLVFLTPLTTVNVVQAFPQTSPIQPISRWRGLWKGYAILRKCDFNVIVIVIIIILDLGFLFLFSRFLSVMRLWPCKCLRVLLRIVSYYVTGTQDQKLPDESKIDNCLCGKLKRQPGSRCDLFCQRSGRGEKFLPENRLKYIVEAL